MTHILVAHESESIREVIRHIIEGAGWSVEVVTDGQAAVNALRRSPAALILDVALGEVHAYRVVEELRAHSPATRVILIASIYNRTGYKRRPTSLYGADDYVEQHHIPDSLLAKLARLIGAPPVEQPLPPMHVETAEGRAIREAGEERLDPHLNASARPSPEAIERAQRLARLIVADIALYNADALDRAARLGDSVELDARLRLDLEEGRLLFDMRVPAAVRRDRDFIEEALIEVRTARESALSAGQGEHALRDQTEPSAVKTSREEH